MSTYYYCKICVRKAEDTGKSNNNPWKVMDTGCVNIFKNLLSGWEPSVNPTYVDNDLVGLVNKYYTFEHIGTFLKSDIAESEYNCCPLEKVDPRCEYHIHNPKDYDNICLMSPDDPELPIVRVSKDEDDEFDTFVEDYKVHLMTPRDIEFYKKEHNDQLPRHWKPMEGILNESNEGPDKDYYVNVYVKKEHTYSGDFYERSSFAEYKKELMAKYDEAIVKKHKWNLMKDSIEYLKLEDEEKERVSCNFEYIDETIEDLTYEIEACNYFIALSNWFDDDRDYKDETGNYNGHEVLFYIYAQ